MRIWLLLACLAMAACGSTLGVSQSYEDDMGEESYSTQAELMSNDERALAEAKTAVRDQEYTRATWELERLSDDLSVDREIREEALYLLAEVQSTLLNPDRDYKKAIATYERFLQEYPQSDLAFRAEQSIARLQALEGTSE
jgi:outer membrane protein assembly factor BamD (BamD/ComL family)